MRITPNVAAAGVAFALLVCGCSGGTVGTASPTPTPSPSPTPGESIPGFTGSYGAQIAMSANRFAIFTLSVTDGAGSANGVVYVYLETQPATRSRHSGQHPILASGRVTGRVDRQTRAMQLAGTLTNIDGTGGPIELEVTGNLQHFGVDNGSISLRIGADVFPGVFQ